MGHNKHRARHKARKARKVQLQRWHEQPKYGPPPILHALRILRLQDQFRQAVQRQFEVWISHAKPDLGGKLPSDFRMEWTPLDTAALVRKPGE